jgi:hypothetical protein
MITNPTNLELPVLAKTGSILQETRERARARAPH